MFASCKPQTLGWKDSAGTNTLAYGFLISWSVCLWLATNIIIGWKVLPGTKTLASYRQLQITEKNLYSLGPRLHTGLWLWCRSRLTHIAKPHCQNALPKRTCQLTLLCKISYQSPFHFVCTIPGTPLPPPLNEGWWPDFLKIKMAQFFYIYIKALFESPKHFVTLNYLQQTMFWKRLFRLLFD